MAQDIEGEALLSFDIAPDGRRVRMGLANSRGEPASLTLPTECLNQLIMTLPSMLLRAVQKQKRDDSLRIVFPAGSVRIELSSQAGTLILTLTTPDGFAVSFGITEDHCRMIGNAPERVADTLANRALN